jgi:hypothetical protein
MPATIVATRIQPHGEIRRIAESAGIAFPGLDTNISNPFT